jgi:hypothetical protein
VADWLFPESEWATRWRYRGLVGDVGEATYIFERRHHDCEFLTAPIGDKHCRYDKQVTTIRLRHGPSGYLEVSHDEGRTWSLADSSDHAMVFVSWSKVED